MKRKSGFTLVEMLIVVVIIGILSAALIPRLTGYMARTRDLKRQTDLRNIAVAVQRYKDDHGEFPILRSNEYAYPSFRNMVGGASLLSGVLSKYLSAIPTDPLKRNYVDVFTDTHDHRGWVKTYSLVLPGEYLYQLGAGNNNTAMGSHPDFALLVAKVETPDVANYIIFDYSGPSIHGHARYVYNTIPGDHPNVFYEGKLTFCDEVRKGETPQITTQDNGKVVCEYTSEDQLYYVYKIE